MVKDLICSNTYYKALAAAPLLKVRIPKTGLAEHFQILWDWGLNKLVCKLRHVSKNYRLMTTALSFVGQFLGQII